MTLFVFLGTARGDVGLSYLGAPYRAVLPGRYPLPDHPGLLGADPACRAYGSRGQDRFSVIHLYRIGRFGQLAYLFLPLALRRVFPLLHNWLTDAYPEATPTGTVFPERLHHESCGVCPGPQFSGNRAACLYRRHDDLFFRSSSQ